MRANNINNPQTLAINILNSAGIDYKVESGKLLAKKDNDLDYANISSLPLSKVRAWAYNA